MLLTSINCKEHHTQEEILTWCQVSRCSTLPVSEQLHYTINGLMVGVSLPENRQKKCKTTKFLRGYNSVESYKVSL